MYPFVGIVVVASGLQLTFFYSFFLAFHKHGVLLLVVENVCGDKLLIWESLFVL
jgi:hypothetical protein